MGVSGRLCVAYRLPQKTNSLHKALQFFCPACALPSTTCGIVQRDSHRLVAAQHAQHAAWQLFRQLFEMALAGLTWYSGPPAITSNGFIMDRSSNHHDFSRSALQPRGRLVAAGVLIGLVQDRHATEGQLLEVPMANG